MLIPVKIIMVLHGYKFLREICIALLLRPVKQMAIFVISMDTNAVFHIINYMLLRWGQKPVEQVLMSSVPLTSHNFRLIRNIRDYPPKM